MTFYSFLFLFFAYSFLGWVGGVLYTAVTRRRYQDRGVLSGPLCILYGIGAHLISFALRDLSNDSWFFLAVFSAVYATVIEWVAGHILERTSHTRWWDYSDMPFNLDGYVCLGASALWGVLGVVAVKWGNPLLLALYGLLPHRLIAIILWAALVIFAIDAVGTLLAMLGLRYRWAAGAEIENRLANFTVNTGMALLGWVEQRMNKAHPALTFRRQRRAKSTTFAEGCSPYKIILLFFIGAFLGDITETIFCRITAGYWMSRSSVVWGPFSIVWGLAIAAVTQLLYRYKDRPASWLFVAGTLLGGAYEYLCSVFTEVVFGTVFWDYSAIPFNLGGRINLLYCFFWGFAAIAWFKVLYPPISHMIESLPKRFGTVLTWGLCVFMAANIAVSSAALVRYNERVRGEAAATSLAACLDEHFDDASMAKVYPKAVHVESGGECLA